MPLINNKILILFVFTAIVILAGFGFPKDASAVYSTSGTSTSINLLSGISPAPTSIDSFVYNLSAKPANTDAAIQFSQDNTNWYSSADVLNATDTLTTGVDNTIDLSGLSWSGANFYYRINFTSDGTDTPVLDDITVNYTVNTAPVASEIALNGDSAITLSENTTTSVAVTGTVTDADSCQDLTSVKIAIYKDGTTCAAAGNADNDNCYFYEDTDPANDASCEDEEDTTYTVDYTFSVQYYADSGTWKATVTPADEGAGTATTTDPGVTLNELLSLDVSTAINYGSVSAGSNSTGDKTATVTNTGNIAEDVNISGTAMTCTTRGTIPVGNQEYSSSTFNYGEGTDLSGIPTDWNLDLAIPESDTVPITDTTYWQVGTPTGIEGTCTGTNTFTARSAICEGWMNAGYCWYEASSYTQDCNDVCSGNRGGVDNGSCDWVNDPEDYSTCLHFHPGAETFSYVYLGPFYMGGFDYCFYHEDGYDDCDSDGQAEDNLRICACNN